MFLACFWFALVCILQAKTARHGPNSTWLRSRDVCRKRCKMKLKALLENQQKELKQGGHLLYKWVFHLQVKGRKAFSFIFIPKPDS